MGRLEGKVAIVTGATGGLGRPFSLALAAEGCQGRCDRTQRRARRAHRRDDPRAGRHGHVPAPGRYRGIRLGVRSWPGRSMFTVASTSSLTTPVTPFSNRSTNSPWTISDYLLRLNLEAPFLGIRFGDGGYGHWTAEASSMSLFCQHYRATINSTAYSASKAGLSHLTRVAALAGAAANIRVNNIVPGATDAQFRKGKPSARAIRVHGGRAERDATRNVLSQRRRSNVLESPKIRHAPRYICVRTKRAMSRAPTSLSTEAEWRGVDSGAMAGEDTFTNIRLERPSPYESVSDASACG